MAKYFALYGVIALLCLITTYGYSQKLDQNDYWLGVGLGMNEFPSGMIALGYEFSNKPTLLIARYTNNRELFSNNRPGIMGKEITIMYGLKAGKFCFSTGLSRVWGTSRGKYLSAIGDPLLYGSHYYESVRYSTVGLPAEIRFLTSRDDVGIGLTAFGNLNAKRSFVGLNLSLYAGKMK